MTKIFLQFLVKLGDFKPFPLTLTFFVYFFSNIGGGRMGSGEYWKIPIFFFFLNPSLRVCFNIDVEETDEFYANRTQILPITRSDGICNGNVREQLNILTAFIDGSQIYGSDKTFAKKLRQNHFISTLTTRRIKDYTRKVSFSFSRFFIDNYIPIHYILQRL